MLEMYIKVLRVSIHFLLLIFITILLFEILVYKKYFDVTKYSILLL